jgi:hypothetical protein
MGTPANDEKMARRIQALIAKAESTDSAAEAQTYFEKAQELMLQYSIDEAVLSAARPAEQRIKPTRIDGVIICPKGSHLEHEMRCLAQTLAVNLGCRPIFMGTYKNERVKHITATVVGYAADLRMFEMMYTALHLDLSSQLEPKPDVSKSFDENVYILHEAGVKWQRIADLMNGASIMREREGMKVERRPGTEEWWKAVRPSKQQPDVLVPWPDGHRLINAYKRYCREIGEEPRAIQSPVTYQRNFAEGYGNRISMRLWEMKRAAEKSAQPGTALALRQEDVDAAFDEFFPPENVVSGKTRNSRYIAEAYGAGKRAGDRANLNTTRAAGGAGRRQLG